MAVERGFELKQRAKVAAVRTARFVLLLPRDRVGDVYGHQLLRSSSSVAANYRAACRARSDAEMAAKLGIAEEEADESQGWLELLMELNYGARDEAEWLHREFGEWVAILTASRKTIRKRIERDGNTIRESLQAYGVESKPFNESPLEQP